MFRKVIESIQELLEANKLERANRVLKQLFKDESLTLDVDGYVSIQENQYSLKFNLFGTIHSKTKKHWDFFYSQVLTLVYCPTLMPNRFSARLRAKQLSPQLPPLSPTTRQLRNRRDENPSARRLDRQLSNPEPRYPTKEKPRKKEFSPPTTTMTTMIKTMKAVKNRLRRQK